MSVGIALDAWLYGCKGTNAILLIILPYLCNPTSQQCCDKIWDFQIPAPLGNIYNISLFQGFFPYSLKQACSFVLYILQKKPLLFVRKCTLNRNYSFASLIHSWFDMPYPFWLFFFWGVGVGCLLPFLPAQTAYRVTVMWNNLSNWRREVFQIVPFLWYFDNVMQLGHKEELMLKAKLFCEISGCVWKILQTLICAWIVTKIS